MLLWTYAQHKAGDVVVLARKADESVHLRHRVSHHLVRTPGRRILNRRHQTPLAIFLASIVDGLDHAVGKNKKQVSGPKLDASSRIGHLAFGEEWKAEGRAPGRKALQLPRRPPQYR